MMLTFDQWFARIKIDEKQLEGMSLQQYKDQMHEAFKAGYNAGYYRGIADEVEYG